MTAAIATFAEERGACTEQDLRAFGFSTGQIAALRDRAIEVASQRLERRHRAPSLVMEAI